MEKTFEREVYGKRYHWKEMQIGDIHTYTGRFACSFAASTAASAYGKRCGVKIKVRRIHGKGFTAERVK